MVCHGFDGVDEISLEGPTRIWELKDAVIHSYLFDPGSVFLERSLTSAFKVDTPLESATQLLAVLSGEPGPSRDIVLANSAAGFIVAGKTANFTEALDLARNSIDSGQAMNAVKKLVEASNKS